MKKLYEKFQKWSLIFTVFFAMYGWFSFADFAGAKSGLKWRDISGAGVALWIFLILGAIIILLQLIPAVLMFTSFITGIHKSVPVKEESVVKEVERV